jgi:Tol biopolymer transport system component
LYIAPPDASAAHKIELRVPSPRWPVWSPDGQHIAFADDPNLSPALAAGRDLWVLHLGAQTNLYQITGLTGAMDGFPNGATWSPDGSALLGAGTVFGSKGFGSCR